MLRAVEADDGLKLAELPRPQRMIVLEPLAAAGLAEIRIDDKLFAVGRSEAPFDAYPAELVADLSRRHARIFCEDGAVYLADLGSKNGTTVNGTPLRHSIARLANGDQLGFGRSLAFKLRLVDGPPAPAPAATLASLTLTPVSSEHGLQPIVISEFPFLISKADPSFARYQDSVPQQLNYLSRRHAHIFLKQGQPWIEDLGSTNGSFVDGLRLDEHALALAGHDTVAFGGHFFVYRLSAEWQAQQHTISPTMTSFARPATAAAAAADPDKTTFVAAANSFLDIFCVEPTPPPEPAADTAPEAAVKGAARPASRRAAFIAELRASLGGSASRRTLALVLAGLVLVLGAALAMYLGGAPERDAQQLLASGRYAEAAAVASAGLAQDPDNALLRSLATQAQLKAQVPAWGALLRAGQFGRAAALLASMRQQARRNPELLALLDELAWIGNIEQLVAARGGAEAPAAGPADAARIQQILKQWDEDTEQHQRAFSTIAAYVPEFRDTYAQALSHVRKLALPAGGPANAQPSP